MRSTFTSYSSLSVLLFFALFHHCLAGPAHAVLRRGHRHEINARHHEPVLGRRDVVSEEANSATFEVAEDMSPEDIFFGMPKDLAYEAPLPFFEHKHQRVHKNSEKEDDEELADVVDLLARDLYDDKAYQLQERQLEISAAGISLSIATSSLLPAVALPSVAVSASLAVSIGLSTTLATSAATSVSARGVVASSTYPAGASKMTAIILPSVVSSSVLGSDSQHPVSSWISVTKAALPTLPASLLVKQINPALENNYAIWNGTGTIPLNAATSPLVKPLKTVPIYSRDQGKGGNVNGHNIFLFADTLCYTAPVGTTPGTFTGAASNSAMVDVGLLPSQNTPAQLQAPMGSMNGANGALRPFVPFTIGESAFNGQSGARLAIWPESSLITLNPTTSLLYAPIVLINGSNYKYAGSTLVEVTVPTAAGPSAARIVPRLFPNGYPEFGCLGGIRSYGSSGTSGGYVYIMANAKGGLLLARAPAAQVATLSSYTYWTSSGVWSSVMPTTASTDYFATGVYSTVDIFYSPRHLTFIMVYQNGYTDNKLWWRYLKATKPILPTWAGGSDEDIAANVAQYPWSSSYLLFVLPTPGSSYTYGGGMHPGYFGTNDITRGGKKMLLSWTSPTGEQAGSADTGYAIMSAVVIWQ